MTVNSVLKTVCSSRQRAPGDVVEGRHRQHFPFGDGPFATAAVNIGVAGTVTASIVDGGRNLPSTITLCFTDNHWDMYGATGRFAAVAFPAEGDTTLIVCRPQRSSPSARATRPQLRLKSTTRHAGIYKRAS